MTFTQTDGEQKSNSGPTHNLFDLQELPDPMGRRCPTADRRASVGTALGEPPLVGLPPLSHRCVHVLSWRVACGVLDAMSQEKVLVGAQAAPRA